MRQLSENLSLYHRDLVYNTYNLLTAPVLVLFARTTMLMFLARAAMLVLFAGARAMLMLLVLARATMLVLLTGATLVLAGTAFVLVLLVLAARASTLIASHNRPRLGISALRAVLVVLVMGPVPVAALLGVPVMLHGFLAFVHLRLPLTILVDIGVARHL